MFRIGGSRRGNADSSRPAQERLGRFEDLWDMSALQMITARWWVVIAAALAVGGANYALVSGDWPGFKSGKTHFAGVAPIAEPGRRAESTTSLLRKPPSWPLNAVSDGRTRAAAEPRAAARGLNSRP